MLKSVIFDMDGVVIDSHPVHKKSWRLFLESIGKEVSDEDLDFVLEGSKREEILRHFLGNLREDQVYEYGMQKEALFRQQAIYLQPIPGFLDLLERITAAGISVALASSGSKSRVNYILDHLEVRKHFRAVVTGDEVKLGKPDPLIFTLAAKRLGVSPLAVLVAEDAVAGVQAAKAAGMKCLGIGPGSRAQILLRAGADHVVDDFRGLQPDDLERFHRNGHRTKVQQVS
jgi:beta-phosphoglucomutase